MKDISVYKNFTICSFFSVFCRLGNSYLSKQYLSYDLSKGTHNFLVALYIEDGLTQEELAKRNSVDKVAVNRAVEKLRNSGYVSVEIDDKDRRCHRVYLSKKAIELKNEILSVASNWQATLLKNLSNEEQDELFSLLLKVTDENPLFSKL